MSSNHRSMLGLYKHFRTIIIKTIILLCFSKSLALGPSFFWDSCLSTNVGTHIDVYILIIYVMSSNTYIIHISFKIRSITFIPLIWLGFIDDASIYFPILRLIIYFPICRYMINMHPFTTLFAYGCWCIITHSIRYSNIKYRLMLRLCFLCTYMILQMKCKI